MPLLWISLCFLTGLWLGEAAGQKGIIWLAAAGVALAACVLLWRLPFRGSPLSTWKVAAQARRPLRVAPLVLVFFFFFGAAWQRFSLPDLDGGHVAAINDQGTYRLQVVVIEPPDRRDRSTLLRVRVEQAALLDRAGRPAQPVPMHGLAVVLLPPRAGWEYGDRLLMDAAPTTPAEGETFSYRDYLARQQVYTYISYPKTRLVDHDAASPVLKEIYRLRDWAHDEIYHLFPAPEAPLLAGILLGIESGIPEPLTRAFQDTGTAHVIAISGFNIAILSGLFFSLFHGLVSRWWSCFLAIGAVCLYTVFVGASPSVVRAAIMGSLALFGQQIGRNRSGANALAFTAALMCLFNPQLPWNVSFQLSFGATLGMILYGERMENGFLAQLERRLPAPAAQAVARPVGEYVLVTLAAQLMTLPVVIFHFQRLSLSSLLANPLILPVQPLLMIFSGLAVISAAVLDPLAHLLAWLATPLSAYTIRTVEALASLPGGSLAFSPVHPWIIWLLYAAVLVPAVNSRLSGWSKRQIRPIAVTAFSALAAAVVLRALAAAPDGLMRLTVLDIQNTQVLLLQGPSGKTVLIDAGPGSVPLNNALDRRLSPFDRDIELLILNNQAASAMTGLSESIPIHPVHQVLWSCGPPEHRTGKQIVEILKTQGIPESPFTAGQVAAVDRGSRIEVLSSGQEGSALLIAWDSFRAVIPGGVSPTRIPVDAAANAVLILQKRDLAETSPEEWAILRPLAVVVTPGEGELPYDGANWLNTRPGGWLTLTTDGSGLWVESSR